MSAPFLRHSLFGGFVFLSSCFSVSAARSEQTFYDSPSYLPYCIIIDKADRELYFFECDGMEHLQNLI
ncbi:MAG: hypothetical protein KDD58_16235, partial [Bdellovibrionales bacterium]|nr:hypothetical protein [Bdellovibrionales bacterium]